MNFSRSLDGAAFEPIGEVIAHKEFGLALVQWSDNGLRPVGMKLYAAPQAAVTPATAYLPESDPVAEVSEKPAVAAPFNAAPGKKPSGSDLSTDTAARPAATAPEAAPFKYRCDVRCRSARCPAALERIAAGWRNGRDK